MHDHSRYRLITEYSCAIDEILSYCNTVSELVVEVYTLNSFE